jgi:ATP-dependent RNA helicase RhlE
MKFEDYSIAFEIKRNLSKMGFKRPTDIQYKSIPSILKGEDVLAIAQTGTGKTAAFAIPIVSIIHERKQHSRADGIKCVVMVPTRELALQITEVFVQIAHHTRVKPVCVFGGVDQEPQIDKLDLGVDILVATPGRMFDLVSQGHINLSRVEVLILDEADQMLALGFYKDIEDLIRKLPRKRQTLFFSATIDDKIKKLAYSIVSKPIRIEISPKDRISKNITHSVAYIAMDDKRFFLERIIAENPEDKVLVFVRTKVRAERVASALTRMGIANQTIHGDKEQTDRLQVLQDFKKGKSKVLITTDVSARGIDIPNVEFVVNYDLPDEAEKYVHRVGRTGRGVHKGRAISFCSPEEKDLLVSIEQFLDQPVEVLEIGKGDYQQTLDLTQDTATFDLKSLMQEVEEFENRKKKKKKK